MAHPHFHPCDRAPYLDPSRLLALLPTVRRPLFVGIVPISEWKSIWSVLMADAADFLGVRLDDKGHVEVLLICSCARPPFEGMERIDAGRAVELAWKWLRHRRAAEVETSDGWRVPMFPRMEAARA